MAFEQTVTIYNKSEKIITTLDNLVGIFSKARAAYHEKKEEKQAARFRRAQTFNGSRGHSYTGPIVEEVDDGNYNDYAEQHQRNHRFLTYPHAAPLEDRRQSLDNGDRHSYVSSDSRRLQRRSTAGDAASNAGRGERRSNRPPLTRDNLRTATEVSATRPSVPPQSFRAGLQPYAETASRDMIVSRVALNETGPPPSVDGPMVHRPRSNPALNHSASGPVSVSSSRPIDMNLAYGDIPPDLATRADLDVALRNGCDDPSDYKKAEVQTLVDRVEALLDEAHCVQHTAATIITELQDNPEAAAAVALTLAELSAILAKLSPTFLGILKGGSPAVFALLASPQFMIGTSIAVGVTVVLFGGYKIIKRISEVGSGKQAIEMAAQPPSQPPPQQIPGARPDPALPDNRPPIDVGYDEALVLEEELSSIECWRRGIQPVGGAETEPWEGTEVTEAEIELISPKAMRSRNNLDDTRTLRSSRSRHHSSSARDAPNKDKTSRDKESVIKDLGRHSSRRDDKQSKSEDRSRGRRDRHDGMESEAGTISTTRTHSRWRKSSQAPGPSGGAKKAGSEAARPLAPEAGSSASKETKVDNKTRIKQFIKQTVGGRDRDTAMSVVERGTSRR